MRGLATDHKKVAGFLRHAVVVRDPVVEGRAGIF